ncbi:MAG TPA: helicase C-terminal domain-containing protein [Candidatus Kryptonia bacterium]|nr:helicase C-terminal domain-containing protein [Candidatus Kryptonia bacterium]
MPDLIARRFADSAAGALRAAIADAGGNEVFLLGTLDDDQRIAAVRVLARGNRHAVPALLQVPRPGEVVVHNHPSGRLAPSDADLSVASALGNNGVGAYIVDNAVTEIYVVVEPHRAAAPKGIASREVAALIAPGGEIAATLAGYEHRPQQLRMLEAVATAFNDAAILTVEAGTGTGKSLAYLLPAIQWAIGNRERIVISTHTINLQEQLIKKDLPFLTQHVGLACTTALVKGRGNYVCRRKAAQAEAQGAQLIEDELQRELSALLAWAKRTSDGSLSDLPVRPRREVWEQVVSENDNCLRARCPFYSTCFFYTARRSAAQADIIVVNHHLLMADLALREEISSYTQNAVLPPARRVIVDEAHHLEDVATNYFGMRLSYAAIERTFGRLRSIKHEAKGVLPALTMALESIDAPDDRSLAQGAVRWIDDRLLPKRLSLLTDAEQCFTELLAGLEDALGRAIAADVDEKVRVVPELRALPYWTTVERSLTRLGAALGNFAEDFAGVSERIEQLGEDSGKQVLFLNTELRALQGRIAGFGAALMEFVGDDDNTCRWIEARHRPRFGKSIAFHTAPIAVGPLLRKALFEQFPTVVLTSATLAVDRRFDYVHTRLGLDQLSLPERIETLQLDSPFDFANQAVLAVPRDLPEPSDPNYETAIHEAIAEILRVTRGGTFVLFTAYGALNRAAAALAPSLAAGRLTLLQQGQTNRHLLLEQFVRDPRAVLFATDSFWEGVDVRGDALRCVIITKLPFRVPTEPIEQARVEAITARGGNAFSEQTVPQAVIKLKQGFGRLIRSRTDRGAVVLLDSRVVRKRYGRVFLDSLPPARRLIAEQRAVYAALRQFFA